MKTMLKCKRCSAFYNRHKFIWGYCENCTNELEKNHAGDKGVESVLTSGPKIPSPENHSKVLKFREYRKRYRENHKDRVKLANENYYKKNKENVIKIQKENYRNNRKEHLDYSKKWSKENKEKVKKYLLEYYHNHKNINHIRYLTRYYFSHLLTNCNNCGSSEKLQFHHLTPLAHDNFKVLCFGCHLKEHGKEQFINGN